MGCLGDCFSKILLVLASLVKAGVAIAIIVIISLKLTSVVVTSSSPYVTDSCVMGGSHDGTNLCTYGYIVAGVSLAATLALSILLCCTCDFCGCGFVFEFALAVVGTLWWIAAAVVFTTEAKKADQAALPEASYREAVWILCWVAVGAFGFSTLIYLIRGLDKLCGCCCGGGKD